MKRRWALLFLFPFAVACTATVPQEPEEAQEDIIAGTDSDATQNSVVRLILRSDLGIYTCSGTLLAPNLVLTARHCVSATADGNVGCSVDGVGDNGGAVYGDFEPSALTVIVGATRMRRNRDAGTSFDMGVRPHGMKIFHDDGTNLCNHDLALILLDTQIMNAPISPIRLDAPPTMGETFTAVGWGVTDTTPNPTTRQQRTDIPIIAVGPSVKFNVPPNEFMVGEGPCSGDSGGPALDSQTQAVLGLVSRGGNGMPADPTNPAAGCIGGENLYTQVLPFKDLILQAFNEAGAQPWLEGQPKPGAGGFGAACLAPTDCQSLVCLGGGDLGGTCSSDCSTQSCPSGYACRDDGDLGAKVCVPAAAASGCSAGGSSTPATGALALVLLALFGWAIRRIARRD